eukprot:gb/GECG01011980.1/.p1 GENE.gb/GECG01011980.1/~~gb/GECG01011980.1/.p1  ORF type:complete len:433 (+),score=26.50 gb/GECG01011980.1/:1-1299(+)
MLRIIVNKTTRAVNTGQCQRLVANARKFSSLGIGRAKGNALRTTSLACYGGRGCMQGHLRRFLERAHSTSAATQATSAQTVSRPVAYWLYGTAGMVFAMVVLGGVTRLTRSGLSMVDWRPQGSLLPSTEEEWMKEFEKYKQYPEYKRLNLGMTLDEFKEIYFMEWLHRMWGRAIGVVATVPLIYFAVRRQIPKQVLPYILAAYSLGACQGFVGWWMVKSGLEDPKDKHGIPRVSPYRLATHLGFAFSIYALLFWGGMNATHPKRWTQMSPAQRSVIQSFRLKANAVFSILALTAASGAFVAGNDAGHAYNDWPLMAGKVVPDELWDDEMKHCNFFENTATVQFDHRILAYTSLTAVTALFFTARRPSTWKYLPSRAQTALKAMGGMTVAQVSMGIGTLLLYVPIPLAACHQAGSLVVWSTGLWLLHGLKYVR